MDPSTYDRVTADFYEAAAGLMPWHDALLPVAAYLDLWALQVLGVDKTNGSLLFSHDGGRYAPQVALDYLRTYHRINPRVGPCIALREGEWFHDHETFDESFVAQDRFYQEYLIPYGGRYISATKLIEDPHHAVVLAAMRGAGKAPLAGEEALFLRRIAGHLARAVGISLHLRSAFRELSAGRAVLGQLPYPMLLVDGMRGIVFRNDAAAKALESTQFLVDRAGVLGLRDPAADASLTEVLRELSRSPAPPMAEDRAPRRLVRLKDASETRTVGLFVNALFPQSTMGAFGEQPLALLVLHDPAQQLDLDPFIVAEAFDLTPAEARVAIGLANGQAPELIATRAGVSVHTVRSQVKSVFEKTGAHRQAEVARAIAGLAGLGGLAASRS